MIEQFDAIILGTGQAGKPLALALAKAGQKTAIIERGPVGGTCVNVGCTPTKTMVASARIAYLARRAADYGVQVGPVSVNLHQVRERKRAIVSSFSQGSESRLTSTAHLELIFGEGSFVASDRVRVALREGGERELSAPRIIINVGGRPSVPNLPGLANVPFLDSTSIMELDKIPERLLVLGGGYIGLEFAQMFRRFGSTVTVIQRNQQLLPNEDDDIAHAVTSILREDGIEIFTDMVAQSVELNGSTIRLTIASGGSERICEGTHLLVAVGRTPNTDALNLASAGIQVTSQGTIPVNNRLETVIPGIYALGDVNGGPQFTHVAYDDYRILKTNLLDGGQADTSQRIPVYTMFIDPQLGRVGLTEKQARSTGRAIRVVSIPMTWVARSLEMDESRGLMKAIVDTSTQQILGAAVLGIEGGELMSVLQVAILGQVAYPKLRDAIFAHPTLAESLNTLFASLPEG